VGDYKSLMGAPSLNLLTIEILFDV